MNERLQAELARDDYRAMRLRYHADHKNPTPTEQLLLDRLPEFRFQQHLLDYIVDFFNPETLVCVEVDGPYHWKQYRKDRYRDRRLYNNLGVCTLRILSEDVISDPDAVVKHIRNWIPTPPSPLPAKPERDKSKYKLNKQCDELLLRWEPRIRSEVLADFEFFKQAMEQSDEDRARILNRLEKRMLYWPVDGYKRS